ncbi:MAG: class I SAM-dependent methyltransferase [Pseudomonadales bacterium]
MPDSRPQTAEDHYRGGRAEHYEAHHRKNLRTRLTTWRERQVLVNALRDAGSPRSALDLPCGTGRFWSAFERAGVDDLIAGDASEGMLGVAAGNRLGEHLPSKLIQSSAFAMDLPDDAVDFAACLRFYHHLSRREDRIRLLAELRRVAREYVAISLWVDGNLGALRRLRRPARPVEVGYGRRICQRRHDAEAEFREAGFSIVRHYDVWPLVGMWRMYLLRIDG